MNLFHNLLFLYLFSILYFGINTNEKENIDDKEEGNIQDEYYSLLNWAKNNSLNITNKIKLEEKEEEMKYKAIKYISKGELLLDIPFNITLNIKKFYDFFPSENLKGKYEKYVKIGKKSNKMLNDLSNIDKSFMAFLFYKINNLEEDEAKPEYIKFKQHYKFLNFIFDYFENDLSHVPSSFTDEQISKITNTSFYSFFNLMNGYLMGETEILKEEIFKEKIDKDEYFKYRFALVKNSFNISNNTTIVPFVDLIKQEFNSDNINCKLLVSKEHIKIKAIKNINKGELLRIKSKKLSNQYTYFFYGKTYEELIDHMSSFVIPIIIPDILIDEGIRLDFDVNDEENKIDLVWDNIDEIILPTYKEVLNTINREDSKINCYNLFLKYLLLIRDGIQMNKIDDLDEVFDNERDIDNIKRIIKGEILFLNNKIKQLENAIEKNKKKTNNKNKSKQNEDL